MDPPPDPDQAPRMDAADPYYRRIFEHAPIPVFVLQGPHIVLANPCSVERSGYPLDELYALPFLEQIAPEDRRRAADEHLRRLTVPGYNPKSVYRMCRKDGTSIWAEVSGVPIDWNGAPAQLTFLMDVTDRVLAESVLKESEERYRALFEKNPAAMLLIDPDTGRLQDVNPAAAAFYGWSRDEMRAMVIDDLSTRSLDEILRAMARSIKAGRHSHVFRHRLRSGEIRTVETNGGPIVLQGKTLLFSLVHDVSKRVEAERRLEESERRYHALSHASMDGFLIIDDVGRILEVNDAYCAMSGYPRERLLAMRISDVAVVDSPGQVEARLAAVREQGWMRFEGIQRRADGRPIHLQHSLVHLPEQDRIMTFVSDISERIRSQDRILRLSYHDELTGIYNRRYYEEARLRFDAEDSLPLSFVIGDVNALRFINDSLGHEKGDELLRRVTDALVGETRSEDVVARLGGDEFAILMPRADARVAEDYVERVKRRLAGQKVEMLDVSIALGAGTKTRPDEAFSDVFNAAEDRMYRSKFSESHSMRGKTIDLIMSSLYEKNHREQRHSARVSELCGGIATTLGCPAPDVAKYRLAGLVHDIGKIGVPEHILNKEGKLTDAERSKMRQHPEIGYRILNSVQEFAEIADYVLQHQERWDGKGYPAGLHGEAISLAARIIAVADAYDAMTSKRTYRPTFSEDEAVQEILHHNRKQFDPAVVSALLETLRRGQQE